MFLIADSGSSKTEWRLINEDGETISTTETLGLNPYFVDQRKIIQTITETIQPMAGENVKDVFFYGAGCGLPAKADEVKEAIQKSISIKNSIEVAGDILGTARSVLSRKKGIACILGTGANSCVYNGEIITHNTPSLGYMLSDWGSGSVMGKDFLSLVLQEKLPKHIVETVYDHVKMTRSEILDSVYNRPLPNRFLASFTPYLLEYVDEIECRNIVLSNFMQFFDYYVLRYPHSTNAIHVSFSGSVAYKFERFLLEAAKARAIIIDRIVQHPMEGLIRYHSDKVPIL